MNVKTKSDFLQKKKQQRKKTEQQIEVKSKISILQKNVRAFLTRRKILRGAYNESNIQLVLLMAADISKFPFEAIQQRIQRIKKESQPLKYSNLKKIIFLCMKSTENKYIQLALKIVQQNWKHLQGYFQTKQYIQCLILLLKNQKCYQFLNYSWLAVQKSNYTNLIPNQLLFDILMHQFSAQKMQGQNIFSTNINTQTIFKILEYLNSKRYLRSQLGIKQFMTMGNLFIYFLRQGQSIISYTQSAFIYVIEILRLSLRRSFQELITHLVQKEKFKSLLSLISDQEQLEYLQHRLTLQDQYQQYSQQTLTIIQRIFIYPKFLHVLMIKSQRFRQSLTGLINQIKFIYEDRKILFVYNFLADETSLKQMSKQKKMQFYSALNMKLKTMDDQDFVQFKTFQKNEWQQIIRLGIQKAYQTTKKIANYMPKKQLTTNIKNLLFKQNDEIQTNFRVLSDVLTNLNKKCLRTKIIPQQFFINQELDKTLNTFKFSAGSRAIELMLKNFPFTFRFESRIRKLRQFIKADKLNHDRTLFLQEEVDPDLVIAVRRGYEFLDAFQSGYNRDLRKKYKIVFFNEQGLQQEGVDGGGIIKQFINRVLKSSFSSVYGMFYQTEQNQILPNPSCNLTKQYQFVGKIVGKAVYQSINIDQKFAQPFLNLLIGRQNTFQDLKFIDRQIYKSMLQIRRMDSTNLEALQQTFTIYDEGPFGHKKYVNLKNLSSGNSKKQTQILVNIDNKVQFVESYADYKCNKQFQQKTRLFRRGFLTVMKSQWLTMFSNQQLNMIISGSNPNYSIIQLKNNVLYKQYNEKSQTIIDLWSVLSQFNAQQKSAFLFYVTSCSRPPTLGFSAMKPLICIQKSTETSHLPTANTCMNVLRLPDYKNRQNLKEKLIYAINAKAGFEFA